MANFLRTLKRFQQEKEQASIVDKISELNHRRVRLISTGLSDNVSNNLQIIDTEIAKLKGGLTNGR